MRRPPRDLPSIAEFDAVTRQPAEAKTVGTQEQLDRIEAKLDQILDLLGKGDA